MKNLVVAVITGYFHLTLNVSAFAHGGHLGELAGHSHWIGLGAVIVAGAIAAVVGTLSDSKNDDEEEAETEAAEETV